MPQWERTELPAPFANNLGDEGARRHYLIRFASREGYPVPVRKKMRAPLATYQHSGEQQFENSGAERTNVTVS
jgi:hypothetical protein